MYLAIGLIFTSTLTIAEDYLENQSIDYEPTTVDKSSDYIDNYGEIFPEIVDQTSNENEALTPQYVECGVESNNAGCSRDFICPPGQLVSSYKAACNLEWGKVTQGQLNNVPLNHVSVIRTSDNVNDGKCQVGTNIISSGIAYSGDPLYKSKVTFSCKEHDNNGGDCHILAVFSCERF